MQKIIAGDKAITVDNIFMEKRYNDEGTLCSVLRFELPKNKGISKEELDALKRNDWKLIEGEGETASTYTYEGYNKLLSVEVTFEQQDTAVREKEKVEEEMEVHLSALAHVVQVIPEPLVVQYMAYLPDWQPDREYEEGDRFKHDGIAYEVKQAHTSAKEWLSGIANAALYTAINDPNSDAIPAWTEQSWEQGAKVEHNGIICESMVPNNIWEPGAPGVGENIWKDVTDEYQDAAN